MVFTERVLHDLNDLNPIGTFLYADKDIVTII